MAVFGMTMVGDGSIGMFHPTVGQVRVVMIVFIDRKGRCRTGTEQGLVLRKRRFDPAPILGDVDVVETFGDAVVPLQQSIEFFC